MSEDIKCAMVEKLMTVSERHGHGPGHGQQSELRPV